MIRVSIAFPEKLFEFLDKYKEHIKMNRSELLRAIISFYLKVNENTIKRIKEEMKRDGL